MTVSVGTIITIMTADQSLLYCSLISLQLAELEFAFEQSGPATVA